MFLRRIEIKGFKSFSHKAILDFSPQVTAIVGPNGSGKSNLVDAIRWALGEQSLKNIRAEKSEDLIFAGNATEKAAGLAEVNIIFDNSDKKVNFDFSEITVGRRVSRDGQSEYYLNKSAGRLKEITEILAVAQLGLKGFSIVNQGAVENILRVSPFERRFMLIEIMGLKNLELKKSEAQRKLEHSTINLDKMKALKEEILPHLRSLKRQANRFERQEQIFQELKDLEIQYFNQTYLDLLSSKESRQQGDTDILNEIRQLKEGISKEEEKIRASDQLYKDQNKQEDELNRKIGELKDKASQLNRQLGRLEGFLEFQKKTEPIENQTSSGVKIRLTGSQLIEIILNVQKDLQEALAIEDKEKVLALIKKALSVLDNVIVKEENIKTEKKPQEQSEDYQKQILEIRNEAEILEKDILSQTKLLIEYKASNQKYNENFRLIVKNLEEKRRQLDLLNEKYTAISLDNERYALRLEDLNRRLQEDGFNLEDFFKQFKEQESHLKNIDANLILEWESKINHLKKEIMEIGGIDKSVMEEYQSTSQRWEFLDTQTQDLTTAISDLKKMIKDLSYKIDDDFKKNLKEINVSFNEYFQLMFGAGKAKLELIKPQTETNLENLEENVIAKPEEPNEEWGVDIMIDIPKTKLKGLELLSGGEKALTAICLLFAIISKSAPPILIMDEIDAALDEANSQRFSKIVGELSSKTQFILITHNRTTMESAHYIYGVTMNENGTSG
ncbi:MAG: AAA family ATPase, partial [Candidatus Parcubacteria bacterium]|nr:AAA family ATPase [Candidatus Parcubacteria bacterium]